MIVAITGTPGTGKTSVTRLLHTNGYLTMELNDIIWRHNCILGYDHTRETYEIDVDKLNFHVRAEAKNLLGARDGTDAILFLDSHLSHLLSTELIDIVIVLRCHPSALARRLEAHGYKSGKIRENLEAEALAVISCEATEMHKRVYEIDTTHINPQNIMIAILDPDKYVPGKIDWFKVILEWY
jgi:adenylate kinase